MVQVGLDFTLFIQMLQFFIIIFIVKKLIVDPVTATFTARDRKIDTLNAKTQQNFNEIEQKKAEYESKLQAVRAEISEYSNQLKKEASDKAQAILDKAKAESQDEINANRAEIEKESVQARAALQNQVGELTEQIITAVTK